MEMISGMVVVPLVFPSPDRDVVHVFWCPLYAENNMNGLLVIDWCIEHFYCAMVRLKANHWRYVAKNSLIPMVTTNLCRNGSPNCHHTAIQLAFTIFQIRDWV